MFRGVAEDLVQVAVHSTMGLLQEPSLHQGVSLWAINPHQIRTLLWDCPGAIEVVAIALFRPVGGSRQLEVGIRGEVLTVVSKIVI